MADERWAQVSGIYNDAVALPPVDRAAFLRKACGGDEVLRAEIESLLGDDSRVNALLEPKGSHTARMGQRIGSYEIRSLLGVGGMGEVYRARDPKLDRDVAIKVLPVAFASDGERLARFQREARVLASLNHPHIGGIHGFEDALGVPALVLELIEGDTLAERLEKGPMPVSEALHIARQIAEALETAHEHGVVHRDLKPANIKIRPEGTVKVLDFGLAKVVERAESPLQTSGLSHEGIVVGTPAYMSPEQARGKPVDRRADIWAFGCVLYEMLTGRVAFAAATVTDTLAAVLDREPDWSALPDKTPPAIRRLLRRCLEKDPRLRLHDMGDAGLDLHDALTSPRAYEAPLTAHAGSKWLTALRVAAVLTAIVLAIPALRHLRETLPPAPSEMRVDIVTPVTDDPTARAGSRQFSQFSFALSPDGRQIVFVASGDGPSRLWLRSLATTTAQPLAGTEGACCPFWAPSSRSLGFFAGGALKRLDLGGGAPQLLAPAENGNGGTWNTDGVIVFAPSSNAGLMRVSATGGATTTVTTPGPLQQRHIHPRFLPDGHRFLFSVDGRSDTEGIYLGTLDGSAPTQLVAANTDGPPAYLPSGWMFWGRAGTLVAQRLDVTQATLTGEPVTVAEAALGVSVAATGLVAHGNIVPMQRQLTWVGRSGIARGRVGDPDETISNPRLSPDGRRVVVERTVQGNTDLWLLDRGRTMKVTFDTAADRFPIWSPDGTRIVFHSNRTGLGDLYQKLMTGAGVDERFVASDQHKVPASWSADGRFLLYVSENPQTNGELWVVPMVGDRTPYVFLKTSFRVAYGALSPDGRWVAYQSNESGRSEIYVRPFAPPGAGKGAGVEGKWQVQVSQAGGIHPAWRPDGKELYYLNPAAAMMAVPITVTGSNLEPGAPEVLFPTRIVSGGTDVTQGRLGRQYDVAPDGRFLINTFLDSTAAPITLLMNWNPEATK